MYLGGLAKNRKVIITKEGDIKEEIRSDKLAKSLPRKAFTPIQIVSQKPKTVWVATIELELSRFKEKKTIAIVMNTPVFNDATDIDYFIVGYRLRGKRQ
ncbi:MAG: hypothetical protein QNJ54_18805 [Prochloraceae cyanobacterium]|nr:hypothetical protein [Prochloraceae cyanobacterium]